MLFQKELDTLRLPKKQYEWIVSNPDSEDLLTWNVFITLEKSEPLSRWLEPFLLGSFTNLYDSEIDSYFQAKQLDRAEISFWRGKRYAPTYPPPEDREIWLKEYLGKRGAGLFQRWSKKRGKVEGTTEVDVTIKTEKALIFIEAKYLSDISPRVSYDPWRDQIVRTIDVGTYHAQRNQPRREFFLILLTPKWDDEYEQRSRLYWYKMRDYRQHPGLLRVKLPHRDPTINPDCEYPIDFEVMARRIGWAYWPNVIALADVEARKGKIPGLLLERWTMVVENFRYKGLI